MTNRSLADVTSVLLGKHSLLGEEEKGGSAGIFKIGTTEYFYTRAAYGDNFLAVWERNGDTFTEINTSGFLPHLLEAHEDYGGYTINTNYISDFAFTPDGELLILGGKLLPNTDIYDTEPPFYYGHQLLVYKKESSGLVYNPIPVANQPYSAPHCVDPDYNPIYQPQISVAQTYIEISPDGQYMVVGYWIARLPTMPAVTHHYYPEWAFYKRNGDTFDLLMKTNWDADNRPYLRRATFSPDSSSVAVGFYKHSSDPMLLQGECFVLYEIDETGYNEVDLSAQFGTEMSIGCNWIFWGHNDYLTVMTRPDGKFLLKVYKVTNGPTFTPVLVLDENEGQIATSGSYGYTADIAMSHDGEYLIFTTGIDPTPGEQMEFMQLWRRDGDNFTKQNINHVLPVNYKLQDMLLRPQRLRFVEDNSYVFGNIGRTAYVSAVYQDLPEYILYKTDLVAPATLTVPLEEVTHNSAKLQWDEVVGADDYEVRYLEVVPEE